MPRDGSGIYTRPPGTNAVADTTIESTKYNANVADVETDLNAPRPIIAGGTGASSAIDAANNLGVVSVKAAQTFTDAEKAQGRSNIGANIFDAQAYDGMQINGSMEVRQELGAGGRTTPGYVCDGWQIYFAGSMAVGASAPLQPGTFTGISNYLNVSVTASAAMAAGDQVTIYQAIEGYRVSRLAWGTGAPQPLTIGFWTAHHRAGLYSGVIRNGASTVTYAFTYTQASPDVQQYNVITIPGTGGGAWAVDNTAGMYVMFSMACGSTNTAPSANNWVSGSFAAAPGQVNGVASTSDVFRITGVTVLPGTQAPTAAQAPLIMRPYDQELFTCRRYWQKSYNYSDAPGTATMRNAVITRIYGTDSFAPGGAFYFTPEMRAAPTCVVYNPNTGAAGQFHNNVAGALSAAFAQPPDTKFVLAQASNHAGSIANSSNHAHFTADARL